MTNFRTTSLALLLLPALAAAFTSMIGPTLKPHARQMALHAGSVIELNDKNYRSLLDGDKPILIDACAKFCGPCRLIEPVLDRCAENWADDIVVSRYDVQSRNHEVKVELLLKGVMPKSLPSLILLQNNKVVTTWTGVISDDELDGLLKENLATTKKPELELVSTGTSGFVSFASTADDYMLSP